MTRIFACPLVLVVFATVALAETTPAEAPPRPNSLVPGAWALQFQIENDFTLEPFNGMGISLKRHLSSRSALRFGVRADFNDSATSGWSSTVVADTVRAGGSGADDGDDLSIRLDVLYVRYPAPAAAVNWYWGVGPSYRYATGDGTSNNTSSDGRTVTSHGESESWGLGAIGCLGAEWFAARSVSLHAEYGISWIYSSLEDDRWEEFAGDASNPVRQYERHISADRVSFDGSKVVLGLSLYF